jgi:hypothetical protein
LPLFPRISPFREQTIIQPTAFLKLLAEEALLLVSRIQAKVKCLEHTRLENRTARRARNKIA